MAWNQPNSNPKPIQRKPSPARGIVAGLLCVIIAVVCFFVFKGKDSTSQAKEHKSQAIKEVKPSIPPRTEVVEKTKENPVVAVTNPPKQKYLGHVTTQKFSRVVTLADGTVTNLRRRVAFTNQMEQILSSALNPRGIAVPLRLALRRYSDKQLHDMFHTDLKPEKGDDEFVLSRKLELQDLKIQVRDLESEGHTYSEIFDEIDNIGRNARAEIKSARQGLSQLIKAGESPEVLKAWVDEKNVKLKELGEPPLRVPAQFLEQQEP